MVDYQKKDINWLLNKYDELYDKIAKLIGTKNKHLIDELTEVDRVLTLREEDPY